MLTGGTLTPAFGRDYGNRQQVIADLNKGLDFVINNFQNHCYCSVRDLADGQFQVRDKSLRYCWMVNIKNGKAY